MNPHDSAADAPKPEHESNGRFARGNKGGPGNPFARRTAELRALFQDEMSDNDLRGLARAMIDRAKKGDVAAAKLTLHYALGKPAAAVEPDRVDIEEHRLRMESAVPITDWSHRPGELSAATVNRLMDNIAPCYEAHTLDPILAGISAMNAAPPGQESRAGRKALKRAQRMLKKGIRPSANGSIGGNLDAILGELGKEPEDLAGPSWVG
jgi:hypothetical protein